VLCASLATFVVKKAFFIKVSPVHRKFANYLNIFALTFLNGKPNQPSVATCHKKNRSFAKNLKTRPTCLKPTI